MLTISSRFLILKWIDAASRDISPIVKEFKENLETESSFSVSERAEVNTSQAEEDCINTNPVAENLERVDREAQLIAARKIIATAYYEKTQQFNLPRLQEEVNQALSEVDAIAPLEELQQTYPDADIFLNGELTVDFPEDVLIPIEPNQMVTASLSGSSIKFSYCRLERAIALLNGQYAVGNLEVRIVQHRLK